MKKYLFTLILLFENCYSQEEGDYYIDDSWNIHKACLKENIQQPIKKTDELLSELIEIKHIDENEYLKFIESNFDSEVRVLIKKTIAITAGYLPELKLVYDNDLEISIELNNLFTSYFDEFYSDKYNLDKCARKDELPPIFDYFIFFNKTYDLIIEYKKFLKESHLLSECDELHPYMTYTYLLKMGVLSYEPSLAQYVKKDVLSRWKEVFPEHKKIRRHRKYNCLVHKYNRQASIEE